MSALKLMWLSVFTMFYGPGIARAELVYNYAQNFLYDTDTGLYWQAVVVPTSSYPAYGADQIANFQQISTLFSSAIGNETLASHPASYSSSIANLVSFFSSGAAAQPPGAKNSSYSYSFGGAYATSLAGSIDVISGSYEGSSLNSVDWAFAAYGLSDNWVPGSSNDLSDDPFCRPNGTGGFTCATQTEALFVTTVAPVPLPSTFWSLLCAAVPLIWFGRHRQMARDGSRLA